MTHGIGHNQGPTMERGHAYRKFCWTKAKRDLVPTLPLTIIKMRIARAKELGLDYKTYAGVRTTSGRDLVAFLYSSNALRLTRHVVQINDTQAAHIQAVQNCGKLAMVHAPLDAKIVADQNMCLDAVTPAPSLMDSWSATGNKITQFLRDQNVPRAGVLIVGETALEREWSAAGKTAGFVTSDQVFAQPSSGN